jgi:hypothetical protein
MHKIIYRDIDLSYKATNAINQYQLIDTQIEITKRGYYIVCVLNLHNETITQKCDSFSDHADFINSILTLPKNMLAI